MVYNSVYNVFDTIKSSDGVIFEELRTKTQMSTPQLYKILELLQHINPHLKIKKGKGNVKFIYLEK